MIDLPNLKSKLSHLTSSENTSATLVRATAFSAKLGIPANEEIERQFLESQIELAEFRVQVLESLKPPADAFGMRQLPREPGNPNKFLPTFKTDKHTYTIVGDNGIGFARYNMFQKRSVQLGFARSFQQLIDEIQKITLGIGGETNVGKMRTDAIVALTGLKHSVADMGNEQFDAAFWLCSLFVLREDETMSSYSEVIAAEKIQDWSDFGYSELDFFFLCGNLVPGYGSAFKEAISQSEKARQKLLDAIGMNGKLSRESVTS